MHVGDIIRHRNGKHRRIIVGCTPAGEWVVRPVNGQVLDILSQRTVSENWQVEENGRERT